MALAEGSATSDLLLPVYSLAASLRAVCAPSASLVIQLPGRVIPGAPTAGAPAFVSQADYWRRWRIMTMNQLDVRFGGQYSALSHSVRRTYSGAGLVISRRCRRRRARLRHGGRFFYRAPPCDGCRG